MVRGERLSDILAKPHAVSALLALLEEPEISAARLSRLMGANQPVTGTVMARHLGTHHLVEITEIPGPFRRPASSIKLTPAGEYLARKLEPLADYADALPPAQGKA